MLDLFKKFIVFIVVFASPVSYSSTALVFDNGFNVIGIDNVTVSGSLYNARFLDGSWDNVRDSIIIRDWSFANSASGALSQMFVNGGSLEGTEYDLTPELVYGCIYPERCMMTTVYQEHDEIVDVVSFVNGAEPMYGDYYTAPSRHLRDYNRNNGTWVQWTPVASVPVPAAVWLMGTGLLGLMGYSRKKNTQVSS